MPSEVMSMQEPDNPVIPGPGLLSTGRYIHFGPFRIDQQRQEVSRNGSRLKLQGKVYQVLLTLLEKPGEVVTREELRMRLWPADTHVNYDANVNTTVNKLRQALGDSADQSAFVDTIPRQGYSFIAKVEFLDRPVVPQAPQPSKLSAVAAFQDRAASLFRTAFLSKWLTAGALALLIASMLFGA